MDLLTKGMGETNDDFYDACPTKRSFCSSPVGRGTIHNGGPYPGNMYAVQGLGVAGAVEIFHLLPSLLHGLADGAHQRGFADAGAALENDQVMEVLRPAEAGEQVLKPLAAVGAQEKMGRTCHRVILPTHWILSSQYAPEAAGDSPEEGKPEKNA